MQEDRCEICWDAPHDIVLACGCRQHKACVTAWFARPGGASCPRCFRAITQLWDWRNGLVWCLKLVLAVAIAAQTLHEYWWLISHWRDKSQSWYEDTGLQFVVFVMMPVMLSCRSADCVYQMARHCITGGALWDHVVYYTQLCGPDYTRLDCNLGLAECDRTAMFRLGNTYYVRQSLCQDTTCRTTMTLMLAAYLALSRLWFEKRFAYTPLPKAATTTTT